MFSLGLTLMFRGVRFGTALTLIGGELGGGDDLTLIDEVLGDGLGLMLTKGVRVGIVFGVILVFVMRDGSRAATLRRSVSARFCQSEVDGVVGVGAGGCLRGPLVMILRGDRFGGLGPTNKFPLRGTSLALFISHQWVSESSPPRSLRTLSRLKGA